MNLHHALEQWRNGELTEAELATLVQLLDSPENRAALREDWFFEAGLPIALQAAAIAKPVHAGGSAGASLLDRLRWRWRVLHAATRWAFCSGAAALCAMLLFWLVAGHRTEPPRLGGDLAGVSIERAGHVHPASRTLTLGLDDLLRTGTNHGAVIEFAHEKTRIHLGSNTAVAVRAGLSSRQKRFELLDGTIQAEVARQHHGPMVWLTDKAEAQVLGTKFSLSANEVVTRLDVTEGAVAFAPKDSTNTTVITAGQFAATDSQTLLGARPSAEADSPTQWNVTNRQTAECLHTQFRSDRLGVDVGVNVLLPPGYDIVQVRRFPVLYILHGLGGNEHTEAAHLARELREAMRRRELPPFIAVFPNGGPGLTPAPAVVSAALARELTAHVDQNFRTFRNRDARIVCGMGHGAHRALLLAVLHGETFGAGCALDDSLRGGSPGFRRLMELAPTMQSQFVPRIWLIQTEAQPPLDATRLGGFLREVGAESEIHRLPVASPGDPEYPRCLVLELRKLITAQWIPSGNR